MNSTLMQLWSPNFASQPAVYIPDGPEATYGQLQSQIESVALALREGGVQAGDSIGIVLPNNLEFLVAFLATTWARAVAAPFNPGYKVEEFRFYLEDSGAKAVIVGVGDHPAREAAAQLNLAIWVCGLDSQGKVFVHRQTGSAAPSPDRSAPSPNDVALFLHTSGTTSRPKGVPLTHG